MVQEPPEAETSRYTKWAIALFFVTLFIPGSFYIGVRMPPYRFYLIIMAVPMILRFWNDSRARITIVDVCVFLSIAWRSLSILVNHGMEMVEFAGASFIELFFGYMLGRAFVRSAADYRYVFKCFLVTLLAFLPFALLEFVLHKRVIRSVFSALLIQPVDQVSQQVRFGFMRVQVSFEHGLLFGTFCAIGFANVFYAFRKAFPLNLVATGFVGFMTALAISSSSLLGLVLQVGFIVYDRILRPLRSKWVILCLTALFVWFSFRWFMGMTLIEYTVSRLVFNPIGAEARIDQITYGMKEVYRHPVFGLALNEWARPFWRSSVFDNFWLAVAVRYGLPSLAFIVAAFALQCWRVSLAPGLNEDEQDLRVGFMISFIVLILLLSSLQIYGVTMTFVMLYMGMGNWFYDQPRAARPVRRATRLRPDAVPDRPTARRRPGTREPLVERFAQHSLK